MTISTTSTNPAPQASSASGSDNKCARVQQNPFSTPELARNAEHFRQLVKGGLNKGQTNMPQFQPMGTDTALNQTARVGQHQTGRPSSSQYVPAEQTKNMQDGEQRTTSLSDLFATDTALNRTARAAQEQDASLIQKHSSMSQLQQTATDTVLNQTAHVGQHQTGRPSSSQYVPAEQTKNTQDGEQRTTSLSDLFARKKSPDTISAVQQMQIAAMQTTPGETIEVSRTAPSLPQASLEKIQTLVDQILVSVPDAKGGQEVRIRLNPEVMPGTEIRFERHEGQLDITFVSSDSSSLAFLGEHRQDLANQLQNRLGQDVNLEMRSKEQQQEQDGRSRQQRNLYEEMEES